MPLLWELIQVLDGLGHSCVLCDLHYMYASDILLRTISGSKCGYRFVATLAIPQRPRRLLDQKRISSVCVSENKLE